MKRVLIVLIVLVVLSYGLFEARKLIEGPVITIESPSNGSATSSAAVLMSGIAHNVSFLTINDKPVYTNQAGYFSELLSLPPGVTVLTVAAADRFGRHASKSVIINVLNYCPVTA